MSIRTIIACACGVALLGCGANENENENQPEPTNQPAAGGNPLTAPVDYLGAVSKAQQSMTKTVDLVSINQAIQLFASEEGRFPKSLNELVTMKYLARLPAAPTGSEFKYDPDTGQTSMVKK